MDTPEVRLLGLAPELALVVTAFVLLILGTVFKDRVGRRFLPLVAVGGLAVAVFFIVVAWNRVDDGGAELHLGGMIAVDGFSNFVKFSLAAFGLLTIGLATWWFKNHAPDEQQAHESDRTGIGGALDAEFFGLVMFALAGMMMMSSAADLIMVFLALETFSIPLYVLVGFRRRSLAGQESAMKYFLLGAFSSSFFLLGIALVYGAVGSTNLYAAAGDVTGVAEYIGEASVDNLELLILGVGLLIVGLGFKVAAVPFHMWTPDAYQGAPSPVTGFMAAATKIAAFAALLRLLDVTLFSLRDDWRPLIIGISTVTMVAGSVLAVVQEDVKRVLAYSSIAHAGFVLAGVVAANEDGISGSLFYLATYGLSVLGAFAIVAIVGGRDEERVRLTDYRGLFYERPLLAGAMTIFLLSLAGVPLTSGFVGKLLVFGAAIEAGYSWLVVIGVLASAVAAFFYLRILVVMYMEEADEEPTPTRFNLATGVVGINALATLVFGLYWGPLIDVAESATVLYSG